MFIFWTTTSCKAKVEWKKGPWSNKKESGIRVGWTSSLSTTNAIGQAAFVGTFSLWNVIGHHWDFGMGGGVHPTKCMGTSWKRWKPCWGSSSKQTYLCKAFESCMGCLTLDLRV